MCYSIQKINDLPSLFEVKKRSQSLALLDAIIMPIWEDRYFSFNCKWAQDGSEMMASMRDGLGNEYFLLFSENGVAGKVLCTSKEGNASALLTAIPDCFSSFKNEVAFNLDNASFYFWRTHKDEKWFASPNDLKSYAFLGFLVGGSAYYHHWAESYYEQKIDLMMLETVFNASQINSKCLKVLNSELEFEELREDILEILGVL